MSSSMGREPQPRSTAAADDEHHQQQQQQDDAAAAATHASMPPAAKVGPITSPPAYGAGGGGGSPTSRPSEGAAAAASPPASVNPPRSPPSRHATCLLTLLLGPRASAPVYAALNSVTFLSVATAAMVVGVVTGTVAATTDGGVGGDDRFCLLSVLVLPLYLQRLAMLDYELLAQLSREFEALFVLANWILVFPCLGRLLGLGWRLVYFTLLTLAAAPALLSDASRGDPRPVFSNILAISVSIVVMCTWIYAVEGEFIPNAFYDKPLLLREDRLAESVGPAKNVLTARLFILVIFSFKYLYNSIIYSTDYVLLRLPRRRENEHQQGAKSPGPLAVTPL